MFLLHGFEFTHEAVQVRLRISGGQPNHIASGTSRDYERTALEDARSTNKAARAANDKPAASAPSGYRLVGVIPGSVFTSRMTGSLSLGTTKSTRDKSGSVANSVRRR